MCKISKRIYKLHRQTMLVSSNCSFQSSIVAQANNARLETAVATNEATIDSLQADYARIQTELNRVNTEFAATRAQNNLLRDRLSDIDLGLLAQTRPDSIERAVNRGTVNAGRCFEILSGSPLTDQEREATSGDEFNRECPWLWPGVDAAQQLRHTKH